MQNAGVTSSNIFQITHTVLFPRPAKDDTVSHPLNACRKSTSLDQGKMLPTMAGKVMIRTVDSDVLVLAIAVVQQIHIDELWPLVKALDTSQPTSSRLHFPLVQRSALPTCIQWM